MNRWLTRYHEKLRARAASKEDTGISFSLEDLEFIWDRPL